MACDSFTSSDSADMSESKVDVLIVGAGPAGLFLATQLSKLKIDVRIIDKAAHPVLRGHADEVVTYSPDVKGHLVETDRQPDTRPEISDVRHALLGQDKVEAIFLDAMKKNNGVEVERLIAPTAISVDESDLGDPQSYPIRLTLQRLAPPREWANGDEKSGLYRSNLFATEHAKFNPGDGLHNGDDEQSEIVLCKYLIGCDGARSWVRAQLGLEMKGDSANVYWGCFDALIKSNLPTIRMKNLINAAEGEGVRMIPRENGLVRVYTQMGSIESGKRVNRADVTIEKLTQKTKDALRPFEVEFMQIDWYSCYEVGQRLCDTFAKYQNRIFIAGDACHTHSPSQYKYFRVVRNDADPELNLIGAGQGMNVSMMDTWNLGWKLALVLRAQAKPEILTTYQQERRAVAHDLINMHGRWSSISAELAGNNHDPEKTAALAEEFRQAGLRAAKFVSGTGVVYEPSVIVSKKSEIASRLATNIQVGSHFENSQVVCVSNAHVTQLQRRLRGDGRWRIIIFAGNLQSRKALQRFLTLGKKLDTSESPVRRYTPKGVDLDTVIETLVVAASPRIGLQSQILTWPSVLVPEKAPYQIKAFDTVFADVESIHNGHGHAYQKYGIDPEEGCVVITRPDQHVSGVFSLSDYESINDFFSGFMLQPV